MKLLNLHKFHKLHKQKKQQLNVAAFPMLMLWDYS